MPKFKEKDKCEIVDIIKNGDTFSPDREIIIGKKVEFRWYYPDEIEYDGFIGCMVYWLENPGIPGYECGAPICFHRVKLKKVV